MKNTELKEAQSKSSLIDVLEMPSSLKLETKKEDLIEMDTERNMPVYAYIVEDSGSHSHLRTSN